MRLWPSWTATMANRLYVLDGHTPVPCDDPQAWADFMTKMDARRVRWTEHELFKVSTVFLGLDHSFGDKGPPILFETMAFADDSWTDLECARYATWEDAEIGHGAIVRRMLARLRATSDWVRPTIAKIGGSESTS